MSFPRPAAKTAADAPRPWFIPSGTKFKELPEGIRAAIEAVIVPAYRQLVLEPEDALAKTAGLSLVYLKWQEILDQQDLARERESSMFQSRDPDWDRQVERHLRFASAQAKLNHFLLRLREYHQKWGLSAPSLEWMSDPVEPDGPGQAAPDQEPGGARGGREPGVS